MKQCQKRFGQDGHSAVGVQDSADENDGITPCDTHTSRFNGFCCGGHQLMCKDCLKVSFFDI